MNSIENSNKRDLWFELYKYLAWSVTLFVTVFLLLSAFAVKVEYNWATFCSISSAILGIAYVLTIRNPKNYTGFYLGVLSSALLGIQFYLTRSYDLTVLYFFVFIPFQIISIIEWTRPSKKHSLEKPSYLKWSGKITAFSVFVVFAVLDYFVNDFWLNTDASTALKIISGVLVATCILANFLLIGKRIDAWLYWLAYSFTGIILALVIKNYYNLLLFTIFFIINAVSTRSWMSEYRKSKS